MGTLRLKCFDPKKMHDDSVVLIIGKRRSGKSWVARDILYHKQHLPVGMAMSGTEEGNGFYKTIIPDSFVYNSYRPEHLNALLDRQRRMVRNKAPFPNAFVLLDDLAFDKKIFSGETPLREIFMNGRHWKLFTTMTLQYLMDMPPSLRQNIDYVILLKDNVPKNLKKLHENFFGIIESYHQFTDIMRQCTENYGALVLDNTSNSNDIDQNIYYYKAKHRDFKMGAARFWQAHTERYDKKYMFNDDKPSSAGKRSGLVVEKVGR